jgi:UDP-glucose 4-epimerase
VCEPGEVDALVHCAGVVDEDFSSDPERALRAATLGAEALVQSAVAHGARHLVYVSSAHVYGPLVGHVDENTQLDPRSDYAIAHFATEQVFRRHTSAEVSGLALRPCAVFGDLPDLGTFRRWALIPFAFPREIAKSGTIVINSTGHQRRNFVGTEDIAHTLDYWLTTPHLGWSVINPVGRSTMSVLDFALMCAELRSEISGTPGEVRRQEPQGPTPGEDFEYSSRYAVAQGEQDLRLASARLIASILGEE